MVPVSDTKCPITLSNETEGWIFVKANTRTRVSKKDLSKFAYLLASNLSRFSLGREEKPRLSVSSFLWEHLHHQHPCYLITGYLTDRQILSFQWLRILVTLRSLFLCPHLNNIFTYWFCLSTLRSSLACFLGTQTQIEVCIWRVLVRIFHSSPAEKEERHAKNPISSRKSQTPLLKCLVFLYFFSYTLADYFYSVTARSTHTTNKAPFLLKWRKRNRQSKYSTFRVLFSSVTYTF